MPDQYGNMTYADLAASADSRQWANQQTMSAYYDSLMSGNSAATALNAAKFAWQQALDTANQTGMWQGQYNMPTDQWFASQFGQWMPNGPTAGQQTMQGQQQQFQQGQDLGALYGQYYAPGTAPTQGQQTAAAIASAQQNAANVAGLTGYYNAPGSTGPGQQTLAGQNQQWQQAFQQQQFAAQQAQLGQQNAQNYLQMLSQLRGPADWAKYQQVLGSTPQGMRDLYAAAMGQYTPGGGATTGMQPQAANLNTMQQQIAGTPGQYQGYVGGMQDQMAAARAQGGMGQVQQGGPYTGGPAWGSGVGVGQQGATADQQLQAQGGGTNMYGGQQQQYNLPAPNQISSQAWNNFTPTQQQMLLGQYEAGGWDKGDVQALYNQSLPKYGSNNATAGTWRLQ